MTFMDFQALAHRRIYTASNLRKDCQNISDLSYRGCKVEDLAIDFVLPGNSGYILSSGSSLNREVQEFCFLLLASQQIKISPKLRM
jgi:E3 ubiquitin-protein ligase TRIP12